MSSYQSSALATMLVLGLAAARSAAAADAAAAAGAAAHDELEPDATSGDHAVEKAPRDHLGLLFESADGRFMINPWLRAQLRYSNPFDDDPRRVEDFESQPGPETEVRRARLKVEGHLFDPRYGFYLEHELSGDAPLLDLRLDVEFSDDLRMRLGQYKVLYNRERIDSSGKQQFAERSIATYAFTLDRQIGLTLAKRWGRDTRADNWLMFGVFEGDGRGSGREGDEPMLVARWQWHFLGEPLPYSQSELKFRERPAASLAFGAARVRGPYTRYSSSGGGQLDGFESGGDERYTLEQALQEFAWHYGGYSLQQEYHYKTVEDHESGQRSTLKGGYAQLGKAWQVGAGDRDYVLELAGRVAQVDWDTAPPDRVQSELSLALNLFFAGHDNKLTLDTSYLEVDESPGPTEGDVRVRLQWDVSF